MELYHHPQQQHHSQTHHPHHALYGVELQDGEEVHSVRSDDLQDAASDDLPLQEHHLDRPIQHAPSSHSHSHHSHPHHRSHSHPSQSHSYHHRTHHQHPQHHHHRSTRAYTTSGSDNDDDDMDTASVESKAASTASSSTAEGRYVAHASPNLQPSSVVALTARKHSSASPGGKASVRRAPSAMAAASPSAYDRKRHASDERTVFARIYFENQTFTSSTVFKLFAKTTVLDVRKSMAHKIKIPSADFAFYVIVVVFPTESSASCCSRRAENDRLIDRLETD